jgi:trehalose 6-phosphate phosphatase
MTVLNTAVNLHDFFEGVRKGSLLILDYDGTLAPFVQERMQAYPYPGVKERLSSLKKSKKSRTIIVSGRSLSDLEVLLDFLPGLELWGSHGLERKLPDGKKIAAIVDDELRNRIKQGIKDCHEIADSEYCEEKPYGVALHWRGMKQSEMMQLKKSIQHLWEPLLSNGDLEIHPFDGGLELRPNEKNKGNVIRELLCEIPKGTAIAYLGDDATDEQAFAELGDQGLKVLVREQFRPTLADIHLIPPQELLAFLDQWRAAS